VDEVREKIPSEGEVRIFGSRTKLELGRQALAEWGKKTYIKGKCTKSRKERQRLKKNESVESSRPHQKKKKKRNENKEGKGGGWRRAAPKGGRRIQAED